MARTFRFGSNWKRDLGTFLEFPFFRDLGTHLIPFFYILVQLFYIIIHLFYILVHLFYILVHFFISSFIFLYPRSFFYILVHFLYHHSYFFLPPHIIYVNIHLLSISISIYYLCPHPLIIYIRFHFLYQPTSIFTASIIVQSFPLKYLKFYFSLSLDILLSLYLSHHNYSLFP